LIKTDTIIDTMIIITIIVVKVQHLDSNSGNVKEIVKIEIKIIIIIIIIIIIEVNSNSITITDNNKRTGDIHTIMNKGYIITIVIN